MAPAWQDDLLALPFRVYAFLVMFVQTLINVRRHFHSRLAVARDSSRPSHHHPRALTRPNPNPNPNPNPVLCEQPEALKKGSSAGRGRGPASGFGSINSGGGGGGGKPGGGGGGGRPGGGGSNIRGVCCAPGTALPSPHCVTAVVVATTAAAATALSLRHTRACAGMGTLKGAARPNS
jgi:hypothetical protein